jgi:hypothetical protein
MQEFAQKETATFEFPGSCPFGAQRRFVKDHLKPSDGKRRIELREKTRCVNYF